MKLTTDAVQSGMHAYHYAKSNPAADSREIFEVADRLAERFATTAVERDKRGGTPKAERDLIRESGLLGLSLPRELGGLEASWPLTLQVVRRLARVDGSVAHVFGFHHLLLTTVRLFGSPEQFRSWASDTVRERLYWGNALNPLDKRTSLTWKDKDSGIIRGDKSFCSGSLDSDRLLVSALEETTQKLLIGVIPTKRQGITLFDDWDNMGQRQTDSGSARFEDVQVAHSELLTQPGPLSTPYSSLRPLLAQLVLCNVYLGIAEGALQNAREYTRSQTRAWITSGVEKATDDPYIIRSYGELFTELAAASALTDAAAHSFGEAFARGDALTVEERGQAAVAVALAKVQTTRAGLDTTSRMFEVMGARATQAAARLDRYWRNLRTHTLHDPVDYKLRDLGAYALLDKLPPPSFYS